MARCPSTSSSIPGKRKRLVSLTVAGSLIGAISVAAMTMPSTASAAAEVSASATPAFTHLTPVNPVKLQRSVQTDSFNETRLSNGIQQYAAKQAVRQTEAKAATVKAVRDANARAAKVKAQKKARAEAKKRAASAESASPQQVARDLLGKFGWSGSQFSCLEPLWGRESSWSVSASNPSSGAYGIPQALPASRMSSVGSNWQTDAATQITWGLQYIQSTYGSPCGAWSHEQSSGWY